LTADGLKGWYSANYPGLVGTFPLQVSRGTPNILLLLLKSRRMRWAGHVERMGEERVCIRSWLGDWGEGNHWEDLGVDGRIILGWISRRWDVGIWTGLGWPMIQTGSGCL